MVDALQAMASVVFDPYLMFLIFVTTIVGVVIGVLPGLGATTGAALLQTQRLRVAVTQPSRQPASAPA